MIKLLNNRKNDDCMPKTTETDTGLETEKCYNNERTKEKNILLHPLLSFIWEKQ